MSYEVIEECIPGPSVGKLHLDHALYESCDCQMTCGTGRCTCMKKCAYDVSSGTLLDEYFLQGGPPIFECNRFCTCSSICCNRSTQKKAELDKVVTVKASPGKGEGLFALINIPRGYFVGEYVGEVIKVTMATERLHNLSQDDSCYIVQYKEHDMYSGVTMTTCIDAHYYGNHTRFANHSCSPNMVMLPVRHDSIVPHLCLFTCQQVDAGTELTFSYCAGDGNQPVGSKSCLCGSTDCKGYLPLQA